MCVVRDVVWLDASAVHSSSYRIGVAPIVDEAMMRHVVVEVRPRSAWARNYCRQHWNSYRQWSRRNVQWEMMDVAREEWADVEWDDARNDVVDVDRACWSKLLARRCFAGGVDVDFDSWSSTNDARRRQSRMPSPLHYHAALPSVAQDKGREPLDSARLLWLRADRLVSTSIPGRISMRIAVDCCSHRSCA